VTNEHFKLEVNFFDHAKVVDLGDTALRLHLTAIAYANRPMTDGFIATAIARRPVDPDPHGRGWAWTDQVKELLDATLWHEVEGGYRIHGLLDHNTSREERLRKRQARERYVPDWLRRAVLMRDGNQCRQCGNDDELAIDHVYPFSLGGPTVLDNLQALCGPCNSRKGAKVP
jgi:hypothetical protein